MGETAFTSTQKRQWQVSDPSGSAWVRANAGSGKTHVLTQRVLRLLLAGTDPSSILCLTYTKAAAAEMTVFPHPTSPWSSRFIGLPLPKSVIISLRAFT